LRQKDDENQRIGKSSGGGILESDDEKQEVDEEKYG